ncbi:unnamed protein product, partial [Adineta steineri]
MCFLTFWCDGIDLEEDTIDAEILNSLAVSQENFPNHQ